MRSRERSPGCARSSATPRTATRAWSDFYSSAPKIVKQAAGKVGLAVKVITDAYEPGQRWIVYCDDQRQLGQVVDALAASGHTAMPFHAAMEGDRGETLRWLDRRGGIVTRSNASTKASTSHR